MTRRRFLLSSGAAAALASAIAAQQRKTKNLILVTADGLRWQDLFTGIDPLLMKQKDAGMTETGAPELRDRLWKPQPDERRMALLPYFWGTLAPSGVVLGNLTKGSSVHVTNRYRVSYPGYSEILTGRAQDDAIRGNDPVQNPTPTFLQLVKERWKLPKEKVAVFGSWDMFHYIAESRRGDIFVNAGYEASALPAGNPRVAELNKLQMQARYLDDSARHDAFTFGLAMEYLKSVAPRLLFIAFDETDDWAHETPLRPGAQIHSVSRRRASGTLDLGADIARVPRFHHADRDLRSWARGHSGGLARPWQERRSRRADLDRGDRTRHAAQGGSY